MEDKIKNAIICDEDKKTIVSDFKNFLVYLSLSALCGLLSETAQFIKAKVLPKIGYCGEVIA